MATKWKNFTRNSWVKAVVWLLSLLMAGVMAWQTMAFLLYLEENDPSVADMRMLSSETLPDTYLAEQLFYPAQDLLYRASYGSDETAIREGKFVHTDQLYYNIYDAYSSSVTYDDEEEYSASLANQPLYPAEESSTNYLTDEKIDAIISTLRRPDADPFYIEASDAANFRQWLTQNRGVYQFYWQQQVDAKLEEYRSTRDNTELYKQFDYVVYCKDSDTTLTNVSEAKAKQLKNKDSRYQMICAITDEGVQFADGSADPRVLSDINQKYQNYLEDDDDGENNTFHAGDTAYLALKPSALQEMQNEWSETRSQLIQLLGVDCSAGLIFLLCLILLCFGAGRRPDDSKAYLVGFDRIWAEVLYGVYFILLGLWCSMFVLLSDYWAYLSDPMKYGIAISGTVAFAAVSLVLLTSQVRRIKAKQWLDGFLLCRLFKKYVVRSVRWLAQQFGKTPLRQKIILLAILLPLLCMFWFTIPFIIAGLLYFGMREADSFEAVTQGAHEIRTGKSDIHIDLKHGSKELLALADDLNCISEGLGDAVDTAVKSERLKSELISNVSHDIKTPLTSIITYIDLLKKCNITDPAAQEYLSVLDQKAQRLRTLTTDLFDASKATSGAMKLHCVQTDMDALLRQSLGERSESIEKAGLDIRILSQAPTYVYADGQLLWRILDNLIANCTRYALPNSRVYITIEPDSSMVTLTMKNISAVELNISADELMQRFTRGDRSRHTEGSGLGLSIAQSLAELMGGSCHVEIDGDLFKAIVSIPKWEDSKATE
ncbi:sensor histidine kinase [Butyricicoccus sp.]|uniref:sensor histidine kinase n=1 Tax=Butyricicoccus sp. TaxID=2049021 RepID=UPI003F14C1B1